MITKRLKVISFFVLVLSEKALNVPKYLRIVNNFVGLLLFIRIFTAV